MKIRKSISLLVLTVFILASVASPAYAMSPSNMPEANFQSIWNTVQDMTRVQNGTVPAPAPAPKTEPAPKPEPAPTPAPAPAPKPEPAPTPAPAPAPKPEPAPTPAPDHTPSKFEMEVVRLVNIEREKAGLKPLVADPLLMKGARAKSKDMVDNRYFSHNSPTYGSPFNMMKTFGIRYRNAGENIASGQRTPDSVVRAWMNSPGHRANILSSKYGKIGVGYAYTTAGNYHHYWTQWFTN